MTVYKKSNPKNSLQQGATLSESIHRRGPFSHEVRVLKEGGFYRLGQ